MFNIGDKLTKENYTQGAIWCNANNAMIVKEGSECFIRAIPEPLPPTEEEIKQARADLYRSEVDPLMSEYNRKKTFNLFEEGEEEALLKAIEDKVEEIKQRYPYPVEDKVAEIKENNPYPVEEIVEETSEEIVLKD